MENCVFDHGKKCAALVTHNCKKCSFRKTRQELIEGREHAQRLLERLPIEQQRAIEAKYHGKKVFKCEV